MIPEDFVQELLTEANAPGWPWRKTPATWEAGICRGSWDFFIWNECPTPVFQLAPLEFLDS